MKRIILFLSVVALLAVSSTLQSQEAQSQEDNVLIRTTEELVRQARAGGTLHLAAETFRLDAPLELSGEVQLIGQGYERTQIVSDAHEAVLRYSGGGTFSARGLSVVRDGGEGNVLDISAGKVELEACQFMGGFYVDAEKSAYVGAGIALKGSSQAVIRHSHINNNAYGMLFSDNTQSQLEHNRIHDNEFLGVRYLGAAAGKAFGNEVFANGLFGGIDVTDNAQLQLEQNRIYENGLSGINYADAAAGSVIGNEIFANGFGIHMTENAQPQLEQNRIYDNIVVGILYKDAAAGSAVGNEIFANGFGVDVMENAQPQLEQNRIYDNFAGISYADAAAGSAKNNEIYNNWQGIKLSDSANPTLENNSLYDNKENTVVDER